MEEKIWIDHGGWEDGGGMTGEQRFAGSGLMGWWGKEGGGGRHLLVQVVERRAIP